MTVAIIVSIVHMLGHRKELKMVVHCLFFFFFFFSRPIRKSARYTRHAASA